MAYPIIRAGGVTLPSPIEISRGNEIIWGENTGRSTTGSMIGDIIAEKETLSIKWGVITQAEFNLIKSALNAGFFSFTLILGSESLSYTSYRSNITSEIISAGSETFYKNVTVQVIEQ